MKKPQSQAGYQVTLGQGYDLYEILNYVKKKYKVDPWDFYNSGAHFNQWCDGKGYGKKDPEGKKRGDSQIWFKEYQNDPQGAAICPAYKDFFDWFFNEFDPEQVENENPFEFEVKQYLQNTNLPEHIRVILRHIQKDFGDTFEAYMSNN